MFYTESVVFKIIAIILFLFSLSVYIYIFLKQYDLINNQIYRLQVLTLRTALFLPSYSIFILMSIFTGGHYELLEVFISIIEGLSFVSFFALFVENLGGELNTVNYINFANHPYACHGCLKYILPIENNKIFYDRVKNGLKIILFYRPLVTILNFIFKIFISNDICENLFKMFSLICSLVSFYMVVNGFTPLVILFENVMDVNVNIDGFKKLILLKLCVIILTVEYLAVEIINATNVTDRTQEDLNIIYGFGVLVQYVFIAILVYFYYGGLLNNNNELTIKIQQADNEFINKMESEKRISGKKFNENTSKWKFLYDILNYFDFEFFIFGENNNKTEYKSLKEPILDLDHETF
jgi:hypothetical protein